MGSGLYGIGISALLANQYALEITSQNLTNINTPGYSRQMPLFQSRDYNGNPGGVSIAGKMRMVDTYINTELRNSISSHYQMLTYFENAERMDELFSNEISDLSLSIQDFFASLQNLNNDPASFQTREVFFNDMGMLVNRFQSMADEIDSKYFDFGTNVEAVIAEVNTLLESVANINGQLNGSDGSASALLDERDALLQELSKYLFFNVNEHDDGRVDINMGKGNSLVLGANATKLKVDIVQGDFMQLAIKLEGAYNDVVITQEVVGGMLGGLLTYRDEVLSFAHAEVGRLAMSIADAFNQQNQLGMDMNSELGIALFNDINDASAMAKRVITNANNSGDGVVTVGIGDMTQVTSSNYDFIINGGNYNVVRKSDNVTVASGTLGAIPMTISVDGLDINLDSGSFNDGDKFLLTPTRFGADEFTLLTNDVNKIALASPIRTITDQANTGDVKIISTFVLDSNNSSFATPGSLNPPIRIEFLTDTSYQIVDVNTSLVIEGPITYDPSIENDVFPTPGSYDPGYQVTLAGFALAGDSFTLDYNNDGVSDNRNGYEMVTLQSDRLMNGGKTTFQQTYQQFANKVAARTHFADIGSQTSHIVLAQAQLRRDDVTAVNMDEEAANLLRYQQAYQAAAHLLAVATSVFDILLDAVMR